MFEILDKAAIYQRFGVTETPEPEWLSNGVDIIREALIKYGNTGGMHFNARQILNQGMKALAEHASGDKLLMPVTNKRDELAVKIQSLTEQKKQYIDELIDLNESLKPVNEDLQVAIVSLDVEEENRLSEQVESIEKQIKNAQIRNDTVRDAIIALTETHRAYEYVYQAINYDMRRKLVEDYHKDIMACVADSGLLEKLTIYQNEMYNIGLVVTRPASLLSEGQIDIIRKAFTVR